MLPFRKLVGPGGLVTGGGDWEPLGTSAGGAGLVHDNDGSGESITNNTTATGDITVGTLTNGILIVGIGWADDSAGSAAVSTVSSSINGALTVVPSSTITGTTGDGADWGLALYYLLSPSAGTHTITLTMSENTNYKVVGASSFSGAHQTVPLGTAATTAGTTENPATLGVSSSVGDIVFGAINSFCDSPYTATADSPATQTWSQNDAGSYDGVIVTGSYSTGQASSTTLSYSRSTAREMVLISGVAIKPA